MSTLVCAIPFVSALFTACAPPGPLAVGYVEGDYVLVAPIETAQIASVEVRRGDRVTPDQALVRLEVRDAEIAVASARAGLARAEQQQANLLQGRRPEEIAVVEAALASAQAQADEAARVLKRRADLLARGILAQAEFDNAETTMQQTRSKVAELQADLAVAKLPARPQEIKAADAGVDQARSSLDQALWRLENRTLSIAGAGTVFDVIRTAGEVAGPQAPVVSILPDGATKLKLYVPETALSQIAIGQDLNVNCDGCSVDMTARISYISPSPEFTPPVIYSTENRQKLVYLIEATPNPGAVALKPGQIVDVALTKPVAAATE